LNKSNIENDWYKRFFSFGNDIGSGKIIDPRESMMYFEDVQHQMNFMFLFLHVLSNSGPSTQISPHPAMRDNSALSLYNPV